MVKRKVTSSPVASTSSHQVPQIPDLNTLRQHAAVKAQKGTKIKSLRGGSVEVLVSNRAKWPHVLSGMSNEGIAYDKLLVCQLVAGFCRIMKEKNKSKGTHIGLHLMMLMISKNLACN